MSEENKQMSSLFRNNPKYVDQSISTVEVEVHIFVCIHEVEVDTIFLTAQLVVQELVLVSFVASAFYFCCSGSETEGLNFNQRGLLQLPNFPMQSDWLIFFKTSVF